MVLESFYQYLNFSLHASGKRVFCHVYCPVSHSSGFYDVTGWLYQYADIYPAIISGNRTHVETALIIAWLADCHYANTIGLEH